MKYKVNKKFYFLIIIKFNVTMCLYLVGEPSVLYPM